MAGGKARPRKDTGLKVTTGQTVKAGQILARNIKTYKSGNDVRGLGTMFSLCGGKVSFSRKKTPHGKFRTFINVIPA